MKKFVAVVCGTLLMGSAALPAAAQPGSWTLEARIQEVQRAIDNGVASGALDRNEYNRTETRLHQIEGKRNELIRIGNLGPPQRATLEGEVDSLASQIHWMRGGWRRPW